MKHGDALAHTVALAHGVALALLLLGCADDGAGQSREALEGDVQECTDSPTAYVLAPETTEASVMLTLERAGFVVKRLPLDAAPGELEGLIYLADRSTELPDYASYMALHAQALYEFVDRANVLFQGYQDVEYEAEPAFLPTTHVARRGGRSFGSLRIAAAKSDLLRNVASDDGKLAWTAEEAVPSSFDFQQGFEVVLARTEDGENPALIEGAYGQGRIILSAMDLDTAADAGATLSAALAENLLARTVGTCRRDNAELDITSPEITGVLEQDSELLAVMPDTQVYSLRLPGLFLAQTGWVAAQAERLGIRFALHLGDVVNNNTNAEWARASLAMSLLHGKVPYAIAPGNHDYGPSGDASTRDTLLNDYIPYDQSASLASFGGAYEKQKLDNTYHYVTLQARDYLVIALEWAPRDEVVEWANQLMSDHPERLGILVTHAYLNNNDRRYDHRDTEHNQSFNPHEYRTPGSINDGQELWDKLVRHHPFVMTFNGHVLGDGAGYLVSRTDVDTDCHQMLSNYQMREDGGEGYLRLIEMHADGRRVSVHTYSPVFDRFMLNDAHSFSFELNVP